MKNVLVLRTCKPDLTSYRGFKWKRQGLVTAPDWDPTPECGHGLHGLAWGVGEAGLLGLESDLWLVVSVPADTLVDLGGKVKFPAGRMVYAGTREEAVRRIQAKAPDPSKVVYGTATAGAYGTATAGYGGTATAGYGGTATAGYHGTATAGYDGTATAGQYGTATAGCGGTATAGHGGTATAGYGGTATAGYGGTATAGHHGTATAGAYGTATAGAYGTATAGCGGTATAGAGGTIRIQSWDGARYRTLVGYVGEDGIEPDIKYKAQNGNLVQS